MSIGTQLGSQFWVGTVAGPTMFCFLERPTFGFIQSKLFPKYGLIGTATSVIALGGHYFGHRGKIAILQTRSQRSGTTIFGKVCMKHVSICEILIYFI